MDNNKPNLFIVGSGRNGTSMVTGLFHKSGYYMGDHLHAASDENPKGYFEDTIINQLNNKILGRYLPKGQVINGIEYLKDSPGNRNGWLSRIPLDVKIEASEADQTAINGLVGQTPFCFKDPRFCYLLHLWRQNADDARMVCVFRRPQLSVASTLKCCATRPGLFEVAISVNQAFEIWTLMYSHVMQQQSLGGDWFFVEYHDILNGSALNALEDFCGTRVDRDFPTSTLNRTDTPLNVPEKTAEIFTHLKDRAAACY